MSRRKYYWFIGNKHIAKTYYQELINNDEVVFIYKDCVFNSRLLSKLFKVIFSQIINSKMRVPFKGAFFGYLLKRKNIKNHKCTVLIFHQGWFDKDISKYLKKRYDQLISILYFDDTIETYVKAIPSMKPHELKNDYDYILTYNPSDADKYGYKKCHACFSKLELSALDELKSDLCFIGQSKDRYPMIKSIYEHIGGRCKCNFIVVGDLDGVDAGIILSRKYMPYEQYLQHEISSNCILEVLKTDTQGATFRCWEAVYYNKKLITNWKGITSFPYYNPKYMRYFENPEDIDVDFIKSVEEVDYRYKGENSPSAFLGNIESMLKGKYNG